MPAKAGTPLRRPIAIASPVTYLPTMSLRPLFLVLGLLALLLAPLGMHGAAMAAGGGEALLSSAGHCQDEPQSDHHSGPDAAVDCVFACAALPGALPPSFVQAAAVSDRPAPRLLAFLSGVPPEAATPPPRRS